MKWLFVLLLAVIIFGGSAWFGYNLFFKQEIAVQKEQRGETKAEPTPDISLPEFEAAARLRQEGKMPEARSALTVFIQKYPSGIHVEEAKDLLGEINVGIMLSRTPSPEKTEYIVKPGDVLQRVANRVKSTCSPSPPVPGSGCITMPWLPMSMRSTCRLSTLTRRL